MQAKGGVHSLVQSQNKNQLHAETYAKMADQTLDHTVFLVGWKIEEASGLPVWIARNSYGDSWGMSGDFYVRMGFDDYGVESEVSAYEVSLVSGLDDDI